MIKIDPIKHLAVMSDRILPLINHFKDKLLHLSVAYIQKLKEYLRISSMFEYKIQYKYFVCY